MTTQQFTTLCETMLDAFGKATLFAAVLRAHPDQMASDGAGFIMDELKRAADALQAAAVQVTS
jgi:hypothetical protein